MKPLQFPLLWPRSASVTEDLDPRAFPGVIAIHDTAHGIDDHVIRGAAISRPGYLQAWHVTSDPGRVMAALRRGARLPAAYGPAGARSELGAGLYCSAIPGFWAGRAMGKWSFLQSLAGEKRSRLVQALAQEMTRLRGRGYITANEFDRAKRITAGVEAGNYETSALTQLAGQPYNVQFWRRDFLEPLGLAPSGGVFEVEVHLRGRFAELAGRADLSGLSRLRRAGVAGAFTKSGISTNAELVCWDADAVEVIGIEPVNESILAAARRLL